MTPDGGPEFWPSASEPHQSLSSRTTRLPATLSCKDRVVSVAWAAAKTRLRTVGCYSTGKPGEAVDATPPLGLKNLHSVPTDIERTSSQTPACTERTWWRIDGNHDQGTASARRSPSATSGDLETSTFATTTPGFRQSGGYETPSARLAPAGKKESCPWLRRPWISRFAKHSGNDRNRPGRKTSQSACSGLRPQAARPSPNAVKWAGGVEWPFHHEPQRTNNIARSAGHGNRGRTQAISAITENRRVGRRCLGSGSRLRDPGTVRNEESLPQNEEA